MKALVGAASAAVIICVFAFLLPADRDPVFMALPWNIKVSAIIGWVALGDGALIAFLWAAFFPLSSEKQTEQS